MSETVDIVVIGAGIAGLVCAQVLQQAGYQVTVLEKSRGVGGRLSTRRLHDTRADHGTCYVSPKGELFQDFIQSLVLQNVVQVWTDTVHEVKADGILHSPSERSPRYVAAHGMNAIAKALTPGLSIEFNQRVTGLELILSQEWQLTLEEIRPQGEVTISTRRAKAIISTVPAPQALDLFSPLADGAVSLDCIAQLRSVEFRPCIAVMAGYSMECLADWQRQYGEVKAIEAQHADVGWIGLDSSKRHSSPQPVFVVQSTANFAQTYLEAQDLKPVGYSLLQATGDLLAPWLATPEWIQVHRWRYAFATRPLAEKCLVGGTIAPLLCAGDWCGGMRVESAFLSGLEAAQLMNQQLANRAISASRFW